MEGNVDDERSPFPSDAYRSSPTNDDQDNNLERGSTTQRVAEPPWRSPARDNGEEDAMGSSSGSSTRGGDASDSPFQGRIEDHEIRVAPSSVKPDRGDDGPRALSFDVHRKSLPGFLGGMGGTIASVPYGLVVHQADGRLSIIKKGAWRREYDLHLIERLELATGDSRLLHIDWKKDGGPATAPVIDDGEAERLLPRHTRHSYVFLSAQGTTRT